jgi:hypothetical protein
LAEVDIERLSLNLSPLLERDGERLGKLIAEGLATAAASIQSSRNVKAMQVNLTTTAGTPLDLLSRQIVAEVLRQLDRTI